MGLLSRKKKPESLIPTNSRLARMPREDLYILLETSLMEAQMHLSKVRAAPEQDKEALLQWMNVSIRTALSASAEYETRINDTVTY